MYDVIDYTKLRNVIQDRISTLENLKFDADCLLHLCRVGCVFSIVVALLLTSEVGYGWFMWIAFAVFYWYAGEVYTREYICLYTAHLKYLQEELNSPILNEDRVQDLLSYCSFEDKVRYIQILYEIVMFDINPTYFRLMYINYKGECFVAKAEVRSGKYRNGEFFRKYSNDIKTDTLHLY